MLDRWVQSLSKDDIRFTSDDAKLISLLDPWDGYDSLPTNWLAALSDLNPQYARKRLGQLWHAYEYVGRHTLSGKNNSATMIYWLTERGVQELELPQPFQRKSDWSKHGLQSSLSLASIELGVKGHGIFQIMKAREIFDHKLFAHRRFPYPFWYKIGENFLQPDGLPFVIGDPSTNTSVLFEREDDRHTETIKDIELKMLNYKHVQENGLTLQKYGHKDSKVMFITTDRILRNKTLSGETRLKRMMAKAAKVFSGKCDWMLFKYVPEFADLTVNTIPITTRLFDEPWQRVGHPPFSLKTLAPCD